MVYQPGYVRFELELLTRLRKIRRIGYKSAKHRALALADTGNLQIRCSGLRARFFKFNALPACGTDNHETAKIRFVCFFKMCDALGTKCIAGRKQCQENRSVYESNIQRGEHAHLR